MESMFSDEETFIHYSSPDSRSNARAWLEVELSLNSVRSSFNRIVRPTDFLACSSLD